MWCLFSECMWACLVAHQHLSPKFVTNCCLKLCPLIVHAGHLRTVLKKTMDDSESRMTETDFVAFEEADESGNDESMFLL